MSNIDGLSRVDGAFPTTAELQAATIENDRIVAAIDTKTFYTTSASDEGSGLLLAGGNYANPIPAGGEVNTASNLAGDEGVFAQKSGAELQFKSLNAGANVTLSSNATSITIEATGGGGGAVELLTISGQAAISLGNQTWTTIDTSTSGLSVVNGITGATISGATVTLPAGKYDLCGYTRSYINANSGFETFARIVGSNGDVFTKSVGAGDGLGTLSGSPATSALTVSLFFELTQQTDVVFEVWASRASTSISATSMPAGQDNVLVQFVKIA